MSQEDGTPRGDADPRSLRVTDFAVVRDVPTRWADEDTYGHVNNAVHYLLFDTAVNGWMIEQVGDMREHPSFGVVAETGCRYFGELRFPERIRCGIALGRLGTSSITYRLALFGDRNEEPAATGLFVHVYVDRDTRRPVPVPDDVRRAVSVLLAWP
ncbi:MAG: thioesterase family protein [Actinomycetota bacterium]|nr:thioesterase family protein [Actinomycetota bacterium]